MSSTFQQVLAQCVWVFSLCPSHYSRSYHKLHHKHFRLHHINICSLTWFLLFSVMQLIVSMNESRNLVLYWPSSCPFLIAELGKKLLVTWPESTSRVCPHNSNFKPKKCEYDIDPIPSFHCINVLKRICSNVQKHSRFYLCKDAD